MREQIKSLAQRISETKDLIHNEEATKTAYIMPFLQILGYDIFNPLEVVPEFTADIGTKAGERVDYAIMQGNTPIILIECKPCTQPLNVANESQLLRYFNVTKARFGILTNGIKYKFFTDLQEPNQMDLQPFLEFDMSEDGDSVDYKELLKFHKQKFNIDDIRRTAEILKNSNAIMQTVLNEFANPSSEWVTMIFKKIYPKSIFTKAQRECFTPLVKSAIDQIINNKVKENLDIALKTTENIRESASVLQESLTVPDKETTQIEIDGYNIVRSFAAELVSVDRVIMRDAKTYCAILFDDNNRRPIIRFYFNNPNRLYVRLFDRQEPENVNIDDVRELFKLKNRILATIAKYPAL